MIVTGSAPATFHLELPETTGSFSRADLEFIGLEHSGPSVEVRVFFNTPQANEDTPTNDRAGFVGFFSIFGHGGCFGDDGHCEMPERRPTDHRPAYALTPITKHIEVTEAVRDILSEQSREVSVTIVPVLHEVPLYVPEDLLSEPVKFQRLSIIFYS